MSRAGALAPAVYDARPGPVNYSVRVVRFAVVREATESVPRTLSTPEAVATLARELIPDDAREHFGVFLLNARNGLIAYHKVSTGTLSASLVHPREVFGPALRVMGVASLILVHNHPSGDPEPSRKTFGSPGSWSTRARSSTCRSTITSSSATAATPTCRSPAAGSSEAPPVRRPDQTPNRREPGALSGPIRAALYARVSTTDQTPDNQLVALRSFAEARGWTVTEFVDHRISGAKDRRPGLDALLAAVRTRKVDVVACIKLDRLARSTRHLVTLTADLEALGVDLVVLGPVHRHDDAERAVALPRPGRDRRVRAGPDPGSGRGRPPASEGPGSAPWAPAPLLRRRRGGRALAAAAPSKPRSQVRS